jgi:hypothetical protein
MTDGRRVRKTTLDTPASGGKDWRVATASQEP